ncbi:MAG: Glu/Leu/Phe/Val dehydrogenase, partial [Francisellaceae bacterium]|nr:Glu/Leu/Phe/Val dehydrogenase [Francisellaceae bacterium]
MSDKDIFKFTQELDCNELHFFSEEEFGLHAIVAIHNTKLGPSLGGCRCYPYPTTYEAVVDVVRLAQGMTFKSAVSGLNLGGGKAVILYDPEKIQDRDKFFKAFGRIVDSLNGKYITAVDVGTTSQDMDSIRTQTRHVTSHNKVSYKEKDPSPITAIGVLRSMQATAKYMLGSDKLDGVRINIQGLGHVGQYLAKLLIEHGAIVKGFDVRADNIASCVKNYGIIPCASLDEIMFEDCDIFAPCAMGAVLSKE